jgi:hypothetical protein
VSTFRIDAEPAVTETPGHGAHEGDELVVAAPDDD